MLKIHYFVNIKVFKMFFKKTTIISFVTLFLITACMTTKSPEQQQNKITSKENNGSQNCNHSNKAGHDKIILGAAEWVYISKTGILKRNHFLPSLSKRLILTALSDDVCAPVSIRALKFFLVLLI
jgi:hypothetical protein